MHNRKIRKHRTAVSGLLAFIRNDIAYALPLTTATDNRSKAFDRVNHDVLLRKLRQLGIAGKVLGWIEAYLRNRTWQVGLGSCKSRSVAASSGVPQGAVLGPRLFTVYVHDIPSTLKSRVLMFADDLKLWREVFSAQDTAALQDDLNLLSPLGRAQRPPNQSSQICCASHWALSHFSDILLVRMPYPHGKGCEGPWDTGTLGPENSRSHGQGEA